ncbi:MAG: hypothetical protein QXD57_07315 [Ignisphaera sp.]
MVRKEKLYVETARAIGTESEIFAKYTSRHRGLNTCSGYIHSFISNTTGG